MSLKRSGPSNVLECCERLSICMLNIQEDEKRTLHTVNNDKARTLIVSLSALLLSPQSTYPSSDHNEHIC